uniref:Uncharacterized protein n=1 Tax=Parascaris univalens TaxID=6257 RepID=A0A915BM85_PARUN
FESVQCSPAPVTVSLCIFFIPLGLPQSTHQFTNLFDTRSSRIVANTNEGVHHISSTMRSDPMPIDPASELSNPIQALQQSSLIELTGAAYPMKSRTPQVAATSAHEVINGGIIPPQLPNLPFWICPYNKYAPQNPSDFGYGDVNAHIFRPLHQSPLIYRHFEITETTTSLYARKAARIPLYLRKGIPRDIDKNANTPQSKRLLHQQESSNEIDNLPKWNPSNEKHRGNVPALSNETSRGELSLSLVNSALREVEFDPDRHVERWQRSSTPKHNIKNGVSDWEMRLNLSPIVHMPTSPPMLSRRERSEAVPPIVFERLCPIGLSSCLYRA